MASTMLVIPAIQKCTREMTEPYIHSRQNDQIKNLVKLRERKHRERQERFLVEGHREVGHAIAAGYQLDTLYYCPDLFPTDSHAQFIDEVRKGQNFLVTRLSIEAFEKASLREGPDGLLAVAVHKANSLAQLRLPARPFLLVLEGIEKPGNLGAILRSADAAGADAVILVDCVLDLYNPYTIRSSQGLVFALPIVQAERDVLHTWLKDKGIKCLATTPETELLYWDIHFQESFALFVGSESDGLSDYWLQAAEQKIRIPMLGRADSLNVAAAAAVCLFEARRQRQS